MENFSPELISLFKTSLEEGKARIQKREEFKNSVNNGIRKLRDDIYQGLAERFRTHPDTSNCLQYVVNKKLHLLDRETELASYIISEEGRKPEEFYIYKSDQEEYLVHKQTLIDILSKDGFNKDIFCEYQDSKAKDIELVIKIVCADFIAIMERVIKVAEAEKRK